MPDTETTENSKISSIPSDKPDAQNNQSISNSDELDEPEDKWVVSIKFKFLKSKL